MPTTGLAKFPYPNASQLPDVPADLLLLTQRLAKMSGAGIGYAATSGDLTTLASADAFPGLHVYYLAADALVRWNGAAFKLATTKVFATTAARDTWTTTYSGLLEAGSKADVLDTDIGHSYTGAAWRPVAGRLPSAKLKINSGVLSLPTATWTEVNVFSSASGGWAEGITENTGSLVCVTPGRYAIDASVAFAPNSAGSRVVSLTVNGTAYNVGQMAYVAVAANNITAAACVFHITVPLAAGDRVRLFAYQNSGGALSLVSGATEGATGNVLEARLVLAT